MSRYAAKPQRWGLKQTNRKYYMKFVHHYTGEWVRSNADTSSSRTDGYVREYNSLAEIDNAFVRSTFEWMLEIGEIVTSSGSDVYQIRG